LGSSDFSHLERLKPSPLVLATPGCEVVEEMDRSGFRSVIIDLVDKESHNLVTRAVSIGESQLISSTLRQGGLSR